ncbi:MAG: hypothetical protein JWM39_372 [Parcubacteria group bacterium]|nr:hypothetical protein [Parcubacteria group bacterium]
MEMLELKDSSSEPKPIVLAVMMSTQMLWESGITGMCHVVELVNRCHDSHCAIDSSSEERLKELELLQKDGSVHSSVRAIMLSAAIGKGVHMKFGSPLKPGETDIK